MFENVKIPFPDFDPNLKKNLVKKDGIIPPSVGDEAKITLNFAHVAQADGTLIHAEIVNLDQKKDNYDEDKLLANWFIE